jgi:DNA repair protein RadC
MNTSPIQSSLENLFGRSLPERPTQEWLRQVFISRHPDPELDPERLHALRTLSLHWLSFRENRLARRTQRSLHPHHPDRWLDSLPMELRCESLEWIGFVPIYFENESSEIALLRSPHASPHGASFSVRELVSRVLATEARAIVLVHNHPSQDLRPSSQDIELTQAAQKLLKELDVELLGHAIVSGSRHRWI